jgi:UDP-N-acetylglucosamine--N-acetylmuramyl-(pentapeptide) pyrophosphoryl-undecaprenol N-acetylglucosamine transferase
MRLIITGGGTGGHVFPGVAVAKEIMRRDGKNKILFVGAVGGVETRIVPAEGFDIETLKVTGMKGKGIAKKIASTARFAAAMMAARAILKRFAPDVVLGVGGYASGPVCAASVITGTPLALAEQNAMPGMTNRWLGRYARKAFVTWEESLEWFPHGAGMVTGNPIRPEFHNVKRSRADGRLGILVIGGSQGATSINKAMTQAIAELNAFAGKIRVVHQTGSKDIEAARSAYSGAGFEWEAEAFLNDMPQRLADADLVISRAGAGAVAEICAVGRPAVYIPFPHAADDHQTKNAESLVKSGAAMMIPDSELNAQAVVNLVRRFVNDCKGLEEMAAKAAELAKKDAARMIADELIKMAEAA